ncbi:MAG TPA: protein kinase family protein [Actinomycetes bacterium]|nr:protein kinase family protein [Actinomycetes bacterium]
MPTSPPSSSLGPGTRLAGRYRIEDHVIDLATTSYWRGVDETLGRDVGVRTVAAADPLAATLTAAARAAAASHDPRFLRVLDVATDQGQVYVVSEWASGPSLEELLNTGPLPDKDAARVAREVAEALATAHHQQLWHRCLRPASVVVTDAGQVRLVGLCVDAAVAGLPEITETEAAREDAAGCGRLLFAALTGRWPGERQTPHGSTLPPPPVADGRAVSPRQVRAGVPAGLDAVTMRALGQPAHRESPLSSPAAVAAALTHVQPTEPDHRDNPTAYDGQVAASVVPPNVPPELTPRPAPTTGTSWAGWAVAAVLVVAVGLLGWAIVATVSGSLSQTDRGGGTPTTATTEASGPPLGALIPVSALTDFDPQGNGEENRDKLDLAIDGDASTAWTTMTYYNRANLGGLKDGVGVLVDLGSPQSVGSVSLELVGRGTSVALHAGDQRPRSVDELTRVAERDDAGTNVTLRPNKPVTARYLLVWLTKLPSIGGTDYRGGIAELSVHH